MERARLIFGHLSWNEGTLDKEGQTMKFYSTSSSTTPTPSPDDVVICSALRTPICKAKRGHLKDTLPDDLLSTAFNGVINDSGLDPMLIGDICVGNVLYPFGGSRMVRCAQFFSGIPCTVPYSTVNRQCGSGLQAAMHVANSIKAGVCDIGLAGGVESMSINSMFNAKKLPEGHVLNPKIADYKDAEDSFMPMGITSENVAERYGVSRQKQDQMANDSHQRAAAARKNGLFKEEIVPVYTKIKEPNGIEKDIVVREDDGIRPTTNMETLTKLKPAFKAGGTTTAGNSSQISDGAAAAILARRSAAQRFQLPVLGVLRSYAVVGVPPGVMGIGPAYAIPEALKKAGLTVDDIEIFEINEAFASQATYCVEKLNLPWEKVNPKGGAIALGHPVGCTGTRQIATLLHELKRRGKRSYGVVSMCMGTGMGAAAVLEYPGPQ